MSGLSDALLTGLGLSLLAGLMALGAARLLQARLGGGGVLLWRTARIAALAPLIIAPIVWSIPEAAPLLAAGGAPLGEPLSFAGGPDPLQPVYLAPAASPIDWTVVIWSLLGAGLLLSLASAWSRHRRRRRVLMSARRPTAFERACLERWAARIGAGAPELRVGSEPGSPFLSGWRGVIWAPETLFDDAAMRGYALAHELVHWRRGDERDRLIGAALTTLFWFHWPLREIERGLDAARELACDAETIDWLGAGERRPYAAALITMMRRSADMPATAFGPDERRLRQMRIKAVLGGAPARQSQGWLAAGAILALCVPLGAAQAVLTEGREAPRPVEYLAPTPDELAFGPAVDPAEPREAEPVRAAAPVAEAAPEPAAEPAPELAPEPAPEPAAAPAVRTLSASEASFGTAPSQFTHTVTEGRMASRFGPRPARPAGSPPHHGGVDIAGPLGTSVTAPAAGVVTHAEMGLNGSDRWGNVIIVDHGEGWQTIYAHLDGFDVAAGDSVAAGQQIGRMGSTGASTGPHLHVEVRHNGQRVDPADHLPGL